MSHQDQVIIFVCLNSVRYCISSTVKREKTCIHSCIPNISGICKTCQEVLKDLKTAALESVVEVLEEKMEKLALVKI